MPKDPLLSDEFFTLNRLSIDEINSAQQELNELDRLIKQKIYPHLLDEQTPIYYQGGRNLNDLNKFVYQVNSLAYTNNFKDLQKELRLSIAKIQSWAESNNIEGTPSLDVFSRKLAQPTDGVTVLYGDGKKLLEKVAVLLDEPLILLEDRKKIMTNLLANKEIEKCINGCYSNIASAELQLQAHLDSKDQVKRWLRSYARDMASNIASKRPFAIPDSYQVLVCKATESSVERNMLHAHNYLLMQAKEHGFPINYIRDQNAVELGNKLTQLSKSAIINAYIHQLELHINAKSFVNYLSEKLHSSFVVTMARDIPYTDKIDIVLNKLNSLGDDPWFKTNKVAALQEFFSENGELKTVDCLKITVTQRLLGKGLLKGSETKNLELTGRRRLTYHEFSSAIELTWLWIDDERKPLLPFIREDRLFTSIPLPHVREADRLLTHIQLLHSLFIKDTKNLLNVIKNLPIHYHEIFFNAEMSTKIANLIKADNSVKLFKKLLILIPDKEKSALFLKACGNKFIQEMLKAGLDKADFRSAFPGLSVSYAAKDYDASSQREGLSVTKELIKQVIEGEFKNFKDINFKQLNHLNYLEEIDFSQLDLQKSNFFQSVRNSKFDETKLRGASFFGVLEQISFKKVDLRTVNFVCPITAQYANIILEDAIISTTSFIGLRSSHVVDFTAANLKEVDFQDVAVKNYLKFLDFSKANLESVDLSKLKLPGLILSGTHLAKANLRETELTAVAVNSQTHLEASQLDLSNVIYFYKQGFKNFAACKISLDIDFGEEDEFFSFNFYRANFKEAEFIGKILQMDFTESDLRKTVFRPTSITHLQSEESTLLLTLRARASELDGAQFRQVKFMGDNKFTDSTLSGLTFEQVEMPASLLFAIYQAGHYDFKGIKNLKGVIPKKLLSFPLLGAELNKQSFSHLFKQGLRDFRGSNLNSFYLGQLLTEQRISAIDLKLEGADYKQSPFSCLSSSRQKRARNSLVTAAASPCTVHFLIQKGSMSAEKRVSLDDIALLTQSTGRIGLKEVVLGPKAVYLLADDVSAVNFHWGYRPDEDAVTKIQRFTRDIVSASEASERSTINLRYYFSKQFVDTTMLNYFAQNLASMGFSDVRLVYYMRQTQLSSIQLKNGVISIDTVTEIEQQILLNAKFRSQLEERKVDPIKIFNKAEQQHRLRRISADIKRKIGSGVRNGIRNGAHFDLGAAIIFFIGEAINKPATPEVKIIDEPTKETLKALAYNLSLEIGRDRRAGERQINVTFNLAKQCIDRGECSNEELVTRDVLDSLIRMRPDQHLGNLQAWDKIDEFFTNVGSYVSTKFTDLKQFFTSMNNQASLPTDSTYWGPRVGLVRQEREIMSWYQSPDLMRLIKNIEAGFSALGYEMQLTEEFSEEILSKFLNEFWQVLDQQGVNSNSSAEFILSVIQNNNFVEQAFNISSEDPRFADLRLPASGSALNTSQATPAPRRGRRRNTREIHLGGKPENKIISNTDIEIYADEYLAKYEHAKIKQQPSVGKNKREELTNPLNNQQYIMQGKIRQSIHKNVCKPKQVSNQKSRFCKEYSNNTHFKRLQDKLIIPVNIKPNLHSRAAKIHPISLPKLIKGIEHSQQKKYLEREVISNKMLTGDSSYRPVKPEISRMTSPRNMQSTLFVLGYVDKLFDLKQISSTFKR